MKPQMLWMLLLVAALFAGCAQRMQGESPIIQLQAGHVVIETMHVGQPYPDSKAQPGSAADEMKKLAAQMVVQDSQEPKTTAGSEPLPVVVDAPAAQTNAAAAASPAGDEAGQQQTGSTGSPSPLAEELTPESSGELGEAPTLEEKQEGQSSREQMQEDEAAFADQLAVLGGDGAETGSSIEEKALAAEQSVADGWHWFIAKMEDYQYGINDWWLRRRGLNPEAMR